MSGLHRPVVVDPQLPNFEDVRLTVHCVPEGLLNAQEATMLCQKVGVLFENQGALVTTTSTLHGGPEDTDEEETPTETEAPPTDLTLVLRARQVHDASNLLSWGVCLATFSLVPAVSEFTFAQEVVVRDGTGFPLVSDSLEARIVTRYGAGAWAGNTFLDLVARDDEEKLMGDHFDEDLSADLYRQLSQIVFNAKMQWQILQQSPTARATREAM